MYLHLSASELTRDVHLGRKAAPNNNNNNNNNCKTLAKYDFILLHDSAFKYIVFPILTQYKVIDQCPTWYSPSKVKPCYEKEITEFWLDTPEYQGNGEEGDIKLFRPDVKLRYLSGATNIYTGNGSTMVKKSRS